MADVHDGRRWRSAGTDEPEAQRLCRPGGATRRAAGAVRHRRPVPAAPGVLDHSDVPMADLYWLEHDTSVLGMPFFVMERLQRRRARAVAGQRPGDLPHGRGEARDRAPVRRHRGAHPRVRLARGRCSTSRERPGRDPARPPRSWIDHWAGYYEELDPRRAAAPALRHRLAARESGVLRVARRSAMATTGSGTSCCVTASSTGSSTGSSRTSPIRSRTSPSRACRSSAAATPSSRTCSRPASTSRATRSARAFASSPTSSSSGPCSASSRPPRRISAAPARSRKGGSATCRLAAMGHQVQYVLRHIAGELGLEGSGR